jgi:hypothetical protein
MEQKPGPEDTKCIHLPENDEKNQLHYAGGYTPEELKRSTFIMR